MMKTLLNFPLIRTAICFFVLLASPVTVCLAQYGVTPAESAGVRTYTVIKNTGKHAAFETEEKRYLANFFKLLPDTSRYQYSQFKRGYFVDAKGNRTQQYPMNYNKFFETVEYIDSADTLALTDSHPAQQIVTEESRFLHLPGEGFFVLNRIDNERVKLLFKNATRIVSRTEIPEVHGEVPGPSTHGNFTTLYYVPSEPTLNAYEVVLESHRLRFLLDENGKTYVANAHGFKQVFHKHSHMIENRINQRIREHSPINFQRDSDVREFLDFCNRLEKMNLH